MLERNLIEVGGKGRVRAVAGHLLTSGIALFLGRLYGPVGCLPHLSPLL